MAATSTTTVRTTMAAGRCGSVVCRAARGSRVAPFASSARRAARPEQASLRLRQHREASSWQLRATASEDDAAEGGEKRKVAKAIFYVAAAIALPVVAWSEVVTATTGEGLQGAALGGLEGISYLVLLGVIGKSVSLKVRTGTGLPAGPYGLVGALEGLAYLEVVGLIVSQVLKATKG